MTVGKRLLEERKNLGLSQEALGAAGGVAKGAQINYEKDARAPDTDYLQGIASAGVDVCYVITGERRIPVYGGTERERALLLRAVEETARRGNIELPGGAEALVNKVHDAYQGVYKVAATKSDAPVRALTAAQLRLLAHHEACSAAGRKAIERTAALEAERQQMKKEAGDKVLNKSSINVRGNDNVIGSRNTTSK